MIKKAFSEASLDEYIGEQKMDVVMAKDRSRLIEKEALAYGLIL